MDTTAGMFEIQTVDIRGVPTKVFVNAPPSLRAIWDVSAAFADNVYLVYEDERITFADAHRMVRSTVRWLIEHGVQLGDRVAIATRNYPEYAIAFWAVQAVGGVAVPLNAWWTGPELAYGLADSGSVVLFADEERAERIAPHISETKLQSTVLIRGDAKIDNAVPWSEVAYGDDPPLPDLTIDPDADATIMYTSGT
ncbi:MAG: acyl--CoA ligase, partial [Actinobacteria bacterium]|nr:acyl--CoA ligase [Actinomycetota bacterium]